LTDSDPEPVRVVLDGTQTVRNIAAARATLLETLTGHQKVLVDVNAIETADLSLIQLLLAARRSARQQGKDLVLALPVAGALQDALQRGGFLPPDGADPFWTGGP